MGVAVVMLVLVSGPGGALADNPAHSPGSQQAPPLTEARYAPALLLLQHDPLTEKEVEELRDTAQEPDKRLKLLVGYAQERMAAIDQLRAERKLSSERGKQMHDLLENFGDILDEIDDNIDNYASRKWDMRKGLKELIEADTQFQTKLHALSQPAENGGPPAQEASDYSFVLQDVTETVDSQLETARKTLALQEQQIKEEKERQKELERQQKQKNK